LKILDYKAAGLPTIATGKNGAPSTLKHGITGLIVPPCDPGALRDAMVRLCGDARVRARMGQAARLEAEREHDWAHTVKRLEELFMTLSAVKNDQERGFVPLQATGTHPL
jgi:glycosyltransferase involved in cell wall biosynthesis